ncbi:hypothetical protein [Pseudomonas moorei]|uniref:hypothetical protein n=1 Tax=Pseudomonas moorei TaxID=395599 RepID=UPI00200C60FC|nr:hypothetical protein [Pseudomonas moorei]
MSTLSYQIGFTLGTVTREFLRAVKKSPDSRVKAPLADARPSLPGPCLSAKMVDDMSQIPAIVRAKGVDLYHWYDVNTRVAPQPARKRRRSVKSAEKLVHGQGDSTIIC